MRSPATRLTLALCASVLLWSGCAHNVVIPDPTVPHQVAKTTKVKVWVEKGDGKKVMQEIQLPEGWWIAGPPVVDPMTFDGKTFD